MVPLLKIKYISLSTVFFFQSLSILSTQDTADVKHQPHVHLVSTFVNYFGWCTCSIAIANVFLVNWAACGKPSLRNGFNFFLTGGGGGEYFWEVVVGEHHPPHLIFTLFQSNIYKVNVRGFLPPNKMDKGMSWGVLRNVDHHVKNNIIYRVSQKFVPLISCAITFDRNFIFTWNF